MNNYLILADFYNIIKDEMNSIIDSNSELFIYDLDLIDLENIIEEINSVSLFNDSKTIILKNYDDKSTYIEDLENFLKHYVDNLNPNIMLIFTSDKKLDERKKITKIFRSNFKIVELLNQEDRYYLNKLNQFLKSSNYSINYSDLQLLFEKSAKNYDIALNELNKIFNINLDDKEIKRTTIENYVSEYSVDEIFMIKDAIIKKRTEEYNLKLKKYIAGKNSVFPIMTLLAKEYKLMYIIKNTSYDDKEIAAYLNMKLYPVQLARNNAINYQSDKLLDYLTYLADLDVDIKLGKVDEVLGFEMFLLDL